MPTAPDELYQALIDSNPWWDAQRVPKELTQQFRRRDFYVIRNEVESKPITAIGGPRQVGKTTLLYQLVDHLLSRKTPARDILFISFDFPGLAGYTPDPLNDVLSTYADRVLGTPWRSLTRPVFVFLDEITRVPNWHRDLKGWFDLRYRAKFFVSSSSLSSLKEGAAQSLAGRVTTHHLLSWKFVDVLSYLDRSTDWNDVGLRLREGFLASVSQESTGPLEEALRAQDRRLVRFRSPLNHALDNYLTTDGFPELLRMKEKIARFQRLREYLEITLANDVYRNYQIRATGVFEDLLGMLAKESGQLISYRTLAENLHVQERTVIDYLEHLEDVFLISLSQFYSESRAKRIRRQRKAYVPNPGIRNVLLGRASTSFLIDPQYLGPHVEGVVQEHAKRLSFCPNPGPVPEAYYWRDRAGREVDIVIRAGEKVVPIEVKYRTDPGRDLGGLQSFLDEERAPFGLVVTRDLLRSSGKLLFVPLSRFLLMA